MHHRDPIAHAENLGQLRRDHDDGQSLVRRAAASDRESRPSRRRPRPASARRGSAPRASSRASARARPSADCRPRACRPRPSIDAALMRSAVDVARAASARSAAPSISPRVETRSQDWPGSRSPRSTCRGRRRGGGDPRARRRCRRRWHRAATRSQRALAVTEDLAAIGRRQAEQRFGELRAARADETGQADDLAAAHAEARCRAARRRGCDTPFTSSTTSRSGRA